MSQQNSLEIVPPVTFNAGETKEYAFTGSYFELIDCPNPVHVDLTDRNGSIRTRMKGAEASFYSKSVEFARITITSPTAQTIKFAYGSGEAGTRRSSGSVNVANVNGPFTQAAPAVTNASSQLLPANTSRRYLLIQNKDNAGLIYVTLNGAAATVANGLRLGPGESLELAGFCATGVISAIGSIANNPNVIVVEG